MELFTSRLIASRGHGPFDHRHHHHLLIDLLMVQPEQATASRSHSSHSEQSLIYVNDAKVAQRLQLKLRFTRKGDSDHQRRLPAWGVGGFGEHGEPEMAIITPLLMGWMLCLVRIKLQFIRNCNNVIVVIITHDTFTSPVPRHRHKKHTPITGGRLEWGKTKKALLLIMMGFKKRLYVYLSLIFDCGWPLNGCYI